MIEEASINVNGLMKGDENAFQALFIDYLKSATPFPKCYLHKEEWTFDS